MTILGEVGRVGVVMAIGAAALLSACDAQRAASGERASMVKSVAKPPAGAAGSADVSSAPAGTSSDYAACMKGAAGSKPTILDCKIVEMDVQDRRLNRTYVILRASVPGPADRVILRDEERAWIKARDQKCEPLLPKGEFSADGMLAHTDCVLEETLRRTVALEKQLQARREGPLDANAK